MKTCTSLCSNKELSRGRSHHLLSSFTCSPALETFSSVALQTVSKARKCHPTCFTPPSPALPSSSVNHAYPGCFPPPARERPLSRLDVDPLYVHSAHSDASSQPVAYGSLSTFSSALHPESTSSTLSSSFHVAYQIRQPEAPRTSLILRHL